MIARKELPPGQIPLLCSCPLPTSQPAGRVEVAQGSAVAVDARVRHGPWSRDISILYQEAPPLLVLAIGRNTD